MILLSASKVWLWVQRDGGIWSFLKWTKNHSSLHGIHKWVVRWWKRPFWFSKKISVTFSSNWTFPNQGGCSQFLISSRKCDSSICGWKNKFSIFFGKYYFLCIESYRVDFRCVHRFQLLNVCTNMSPFQIPPAYRAYPKNNPGKTFFPNWWILDWSFAVIGWCSTNEPNGMIGPLQNVFHGASVHQIIDLERFADRYSIP